MPPRERGLRVAFYTEVNFLGHRAQRPLSPEFRGYLLCGAGSGLFSPRLFAERPELPVPPRPQLHARTLRPDFSRSG